ncbi:hypothetical protein Pcinc_031196 [Petrolisthes cinctipes]|uniref:Major facilitator superfamily (MFS) profile domain-containing protein n=1 Tax=Petrolisthes cinctipes TaxID=88211 RepID=A0AAE1EWV8_PETCI|nr:hypothetical protein Pcinc_031196 [Petrolisthes cinctipes]
MSLETKEGHGKEENKTINEEKSKEEEKKKMSYVTKKEQEWEGDKGIINGGGGEEGEKKINWEGNEGETNGKISKDKRGGGEEDEQRKNEMGQQTLHLVSDGGDEGGGGMEGTDKECDEGFDTALELAGSWCRWQKRVFVIASCSQIFSAIHAILAVFLSFTPDHWCRVEGLETETVLEVDESNRTTLYYLRNITIPRYGDEWAKCVYYNHSYASLLNHQQDLLSGTNFSHTNTPTASCSSWVYDDSVFTSTLVSEFNLVCDRRWMMATVQASYMSGLLIGSLVMGQLSDRFGRRVMALVCVVCGCVVGTSAAFVTSYVQFITLRFFIAFFYGGLMVINFVLILEVVKPSARTMCGLLNAFFFGLGISVLPGVAYFIRDWRNLEMTIGLSSIILTSYYWLLPESPRWLASQQREEEAVKILQDIARTNGRALPPHQHLLNLVSRSYQKKTRGDFPDDITMAKSNRRHWYDGVVECAQSQLILMRTPNMRRRALICFYLWFAAASVYYGLIFSGGNIKADPFLMIVISGLVELPASAIFIHPVRKFGRRPGTCGMFMASALCLFAILAVPEDMIMVNFCLVNLGKFFTTPVFQLQYIYTSELFPTTVRNMAVGTCSMVARIGCVITPYIITLLGDVHYALPSTVFAVFAMSAGLLTLLLPETTNALLPETTEEIEAMIK